MSNDAYKIIQDSFLRIRNLGGNGVVTITARQLEGYVRLAEASARMRLSDTVNEIDANNAAELIESYLYRIAGSDDGSLDIDRIASEHSARERSGLKMIKDVIRMASDTGISLEEVIARCQSEGLTEDQIHDAFKKMKANNEIYEPKPGFFKMLD
jgi:replicative DNA helicase Mcm